MKQTIKDLGLFTLLYILLLVLDYITSASNTLQPYTEFIMPLALLLIIVVIVLYVKYRAYKHKTWVQNNQYETLQEQYVNKCNDCLDMNELYNDELDKRIKIEQKLKEVEQRNKILIDHNNAKIDIGDLCTTTKYQKERKVIAIRLLEDKLQYKLGTTWYNQNEIRKVNKGGK